MAGRVEGKVALIKGAARGQGRSHAVKLASEGADIIAIDICAPFAGLVYPPATEADLAETVRLVEALDRRIVATVADTRDAEGLRRAVDDGVTQLGRLDVVLANAGICHVAAWDETTPQQWRDTIDVNITGTWNTVRAGAPHLIAAGGGSIVLTSSAAGLVGLPFLSAYVASKHAITGLARTFAAELARHHIRVNSLHPAPVETPMGELGAVMGSALERDPRLGSMFMNLLPIDQTQAEDQSNAVLFLASDESRYVTALAMTVDAGTTQL